MTATERRALEIVRDLSPRPRAFAQKMWPDSPGWSRMSPCGYGVSRGAAMPRTGGAYLGKLSHKGWVTRVHASRFDASYKITAEGIAALAAPPTALTRSET